MPEPRPIQLVLQGGGAKIFALIAALEALDQAVRDGKIAVKRIAGTSAGAILGTLYAAGIDPLTIREAFSSVPLDRMMSFRGVWGKGSAILRALRSRPLADDRMIAGLLDRLLRAKLQQVRRSEPVLLKELRIPTVLVASDVSGRKRIVYDSEGDGRDRSAVSCVLDSCAIPFFFRAAGRDSQPLVLDGGLCENLPSDLLAPGIAQYGDIVAISFVEEAPATPRTPRDLALALLDTAINASVRRSKAAGNLFVIELDSCSIGTFDFAKAQRALEAHSSDFAHARERTARQLEELYSARGRRWVSQNRWDSADPATMGQLFKVYKSQQLPRPFQYFSRRFVIEANSLLQEGEEGFGARDLVVQMIEFAPSLDPIDSVAAQIFADKGQRPSDVSCDVYDSNGNPVPFQPVPVRDPDDETMYGLLVFFTPPLLPEPDGKRYFLRTEFRIGEAFPELKKGASDAMGSRIMRADRVVDRAELMVHLPKSFGEIVIASEPSPHFPVQPIDPQELWKLQGRGHFRVHGWCAERVPPGAVVAIRLRKS